MDEGKNVGILCTVYVCPMGMHIYKHVHVCVHLDVYVHVTTEF